VIGKRRDGKGSDRRGEMAKGVIGKRRDGKGSDRNRRDGKGSDRKEERWERE